ncbi:MULTISPECIES: YqgQ family protein [Gracilibacillus]|uniref:DUF910 domain-containing protein n=1 Tax=Gracilibacillus dipsosauri TaxID=178340 RepID=A0A317L0D9_9BACI|nr:YqgQ family protein [Gracilibacillus dipsosauri]PWU68520.1 DUF910 domain-containing protein [Gracilibacillus dipsosauri]
MKSVYDVRQLLKQFGTIIYIGDRLADLEMMEIEIRELYNTKAISKEQFMQAISILKQEIDIESRGG